MVLYSSGPPSAMRKVMWKAAPYPAMTMKRNTSRPLVSSITSHTTSTNANWLALKARAQYWTRKSSRMHCAASRMVSQSLFRVQRDRCTTLTAIWRLCWGWGGTGRG